MKYIVFFALILCSLTFTSSYALADGFINDSTGVINFNDNNIYYVFYDDFTPDSLNFAGYDWTSATYTVDDMATMFGKDYTSTYWLAIPIADNGVCFNGGDPDFALCDSVASETATWQLSPGPAPTGGMWAGGSIFGSTTPLELAASVASGVTTTGASIWPLFAIVGIALAFVIAGYVVSFIRKSIGNRQIEQLRRDSVIEQIDAKSNLERDEIEKKYEDKVESVAEKYGIRPKDWF